MVLNNFIVPHSSESEIRSLCLMKCTIEMLQNMPYFWNTKAHEVIFHFMLYSIFPPNECPGLCRHRPVHSLEEEKKVAAQNENRNLPTWVFVFQKHGKF